MVYRGVTASCFLSVLMAVGLCSLTTAQENGRTTVEGIVLENDYVRMAIGADAQIRSFFDKMQVKEYLLKPGAHHMMSIVKDDKTFESTLLAPGRNKSEMLVGFGDSGVTATFGVKMAPHYFTFELTDLRGDGVTSITLCRLTLCISGVIGEVVAVARDTRFAAGVQAMNIKMEATAGKAGKAGEGAVLIVKDSTQYGPLTGAKFALFGCPAEKVLDTIGEIEAGEGLPHPMLAGKWGKVSPEATKSYLIINYSEKNIDEVLAYAQKGGFTYIYHPNPFETWGHWSLRKSEFPNGYAGLKALVQKANAVGIKVGLHTLSGGITVNDPYVTPTPDPRLEKYGHATLAADVDECATTLLVRDPQGRFGATKIIQIGHELIEYKESTGKDPIQLTGCVRGLYGTKTTKHPTGAKVSTLVVNSYKGFVPEPDSTLIDEMAERIASIFNECGLNQISFDGWEWHGYNKKFYGMNKYLVAVAKRIKTELIADASGVSHYGWHIFTRMNWGELTQSVRVDVDEYRARNCAFFERNLMPKALGWWRLGLAGLDWEATPMEDIEYLLAKAAGYNACHALTTSLEELKRHGLTEKVLATCRVWDVARYANAFTEDQKARLRQRGTDFHLEATGDGRWSLTPIAYSPMYWSRGAGSAGGKDMPSFSSAGDVRPANRCEIKNPFGAQPLRFQLRALPAFDYGHSENINLMPPDTTSLVREPGLHKEAPTIDARLEGQLCGQPALTLTARYSGHKPSYVTRLVYTLPHPINLAQHRGIGMWVRGDGKGELLFVELVDVNKHVRPYYVPINFTGERYIELPSGETSLSRYYDYDWNNWSGFASWWVTLKGFNYAKVAAITFGFNAIPAHTEVTCTVAGVKALREIFAPLTNPEFSVNGKTVRFPVALNTGQYLVCEGKKTAHVFDANWHELSAIDADGELPTIDPGAQSVMVTWSTSNGQAPWGRVRLKVVGPSESVSPPLARE